MKQVNSNPTSNFNVSLTTYTFTATGEGGRVTAEGVSALERAQSVILSITSGTAEGFTTLTEYFVIPVDATHIDLAETKEDAKNGVVITTTGDAGGGTIYPNYRIGGVIYVGVGGDVNMRGFSEDEKGTASFSLHKNLSDGAILPFMIKDISTYLTTATDIVAWIA